MLDMAVRLSVRAAVCLSVRMKLHFNDVKMMNTADEFIVVFSRGHATLHLAVPVGPSVCRPSEISLNFE